MTELCYKFVIPEGDRPGSRTLNIIPTPRPYGERVRVRGGDIRKRRSEQPPLIPTFSP
jgi:hypothetical protein